MGKIKQREYSDFDENEPLQEEEAQFAEPGLQLAEEDADALEEGEESMRLRRTWRDTEKYKEMRELYKIINDELYLGFDADEFPEDEA